jgi:hypothetical protein
MDNAYVEAGVTLAEQYKAAGRTADAIKVLKTVLARNPSDTTIPPILAGYEASATPTATP